MLGEVCKPRSVVAFRPSFAFCTSFDFRASYPRLGSHSLAHRGFAIGVLLSAALAASPPAWAADEWTRFRGPNGLGAISTMDFPAELSERHVAWRIELGGKGHSSPIVAQEWVFVASADPETGNQLVQCFQRQDGREVWRREAPGRIFPKHEFNSFASSTPAWADGTLFYTWATPEHLRVIAMRGASGETIWERDLGPFVSQHGFGASPIVFEDLLIVPNEQDGESFIAALDVRDGQIRWMTPRRSEKAAYSTPTVFRPDQGDPQLIFTSWAHGVYAVEPRSGKPLWELPVFHNRTVGSPLLVGGLVFASSGEGGIGREMFAVRVGLPDQKREPAVAYEIRGSLPYVTTPIARDGLVFLLYDRGAMTCLEAESGEVVWRQRLSGEFFSSPIRLGDKLYLLSRGGEMFVVAAERQFRLLGGYDFGEPSHATPAAAEGELFVRTERHLIKLQAAARPHDSDR